MTSHVIRLPSFFYFCESLIGRDTKNGDIVSRRITSQRKERFSITFSPLRNILLWIPNGNTADEIVTYYPEGDVLVD